MRTHVKDGRKEHGPFTVRTPGSIQAKRFPGQWPAALAQGEDLVELGPQAPWGWVQGGERGGGHSPALNSHCPLADVACRWPGTSHSYRTFLSWREPEGGPQRLSRG